MTLLRKIIVGLEIGWGLLVCCQLLLALKHHMFGQWEFVLASMLLIVGIVFLTKRQFFEPLVSSAMTSVG